MSVRYFIGLSLWISITRAQEGIILIAEADFGRAVKSVSTKGKHVTTIHPTGTWSEPRGFTFNSNTNMVYVFDSGTDKITTFDLNSPETLLHVGSIPDGWLYDITMDTIQGHLYVPDTYRDIIYRVNTDGTGLTEWIQADDPTGVAVHEQTGYLYWSEYNNGNIARAPLSNSSLYEIIVTGVSGPRGLHFEANTMYWCALWAAEVGQASIDGADQRIIATIPRPFYITGMAEHLYVSSGYKPSGGSVIYDIYNGESTAMDLDEPTNAYGILVIPLDNRVSVQYSELTTSTSSIDNTSQKDEAMLEPTTINSNPHEDERLKETTDTLDSINSNTNEDEGIKQTTDSTDLDNSTIGENPNVKQTTQETDTEKMDAIADENTVFSPTVLIGIITGVVAVVVIIAVTGIVITVLVLKNRNKRDTKPKDVKVVNSEKLTSSVKQDAVGQKQKATSPELTNDNSVYMDIDDITTNSIIATNDKHSVVYEEPLSRTYESTDPLQRHTYGNMKLYTTLDQSDD